MAAEGTARPRVVVADDHQHVLDRVVSTLAEEFAVVGTAADGEQLVAAEAALRPDVLVVDVAMPKMGGLDAAAAVRRRGSRVAIVCLSAYAERDVLEAAVAAGVLGYVSKTCLLQDLVPAIRSALEGRRYVSACVLRTLEPAG